MGQASKLKLARICSSLLQLESLLSSLQCGWRPSTDIAQLVVNVVHHPVAGTQIHGCTTQALLTRVVEISVCDG